MDPREQRGLEIAARFCIDQSGDFWIVPSQVGNGKYVVKLAGEQHCNCPDHTTRGVKCKHIFAAEYIVECRDNGDGTATVTETVQVTETKKRTYSQNWPAYNAAQTNEKDQFRVLLSDLCSGIAEPPRTGRGRPPIPLADAMFSATYKVYSTVSGRRFMTDLREANEKGYVRRLPCYNSIFNVLESPATTPLLGHLITESAMPLKSLESHFSCDSSGFSASRFDRWYDHKHGGQRIQRAWVKAHIMCGVKTNVITAVEIHGKNANDAPLLPPLLKATTQRFDVEEVSADMGYISENNLQVVTNAGARPLIPFKHNATDAKGGLWAKMFHYFNLNQEEFLSRYHLRSNVETTFSMVKAKFGDSIRSKTNTAMVNEVLANVSAPQYLLCDSGDVRIGCRAEFLGRIAGCPKSPLIQSFNGQSR
ncbi:MAG: transposase [Planctomycetes bacterium]|nr:transposase [Planctomycetota bacterium]